MANQIFKCTIGPFEISDAFSIVDFIFCGDYLSASCVEKGKDDWFVEILAESPFDIKKLQAELREYSYSSLEEEVLENVDWLAKCFENFKPIKVGEFYIYGPHLRA